MNCSQIQFIVHMVMTAVVMTHILAVMMQTRGMREARLLSTHILGSQLSFSSIKL